MKRIVIKLYILYIKVKDFLKTAFAALQLTVCKLQANLYHESNGKKYYVLRTDMNRYKIMTSDEIKEYQMEFPKRERKINYYTLIKNACYQTKSK